uniref:Uncharacterized protein n=1 Tax=Cacopsylla melanoneura TaxID=428564 RepID=A0A8D9ANW7_9HEMI
MPNPPMAFMYSTAVTSAPRRPHTEPSSSPITPAPITIIFLGTFFKLRAPVLDTTVSSSTSIPGNGVTSDPVAIRMFLVFTSSLEPSGLRTVTVFGPVILPCPFFRATLFDLNRWTIPPVRAFTASLLVPIIVSRFNLTPSTSMPLAFMSPEWAIW